MEEKVLLSVSQKNGLSVKRMEPHVVNAAAGKQP